MLHQIIDIKAQDRIITLQLCKDKTVFKCIKLFMETYLRAMKHHLLNRINSVTWHKRKCPAIKFT